MANLGSHMSSLADGNGDQTQTSPGNKGRRIDLYTQLWLACAGSLVKIPQEGDKVFYFPQGHIEQVEANISRDSNFEMPIYNLPSKILCKVVHVQLKAEAYTDEVFAQITLLPESEESSQESSTSTYKPRKVFSRSFCKKLTPSDTSTHGGFSIPKRHADGCFPPLDIDQDPPTQELIAKDLNGSEWYFRHIFRGQPRRHLITTGWSVFVGAKKLVAGDTVIFIRGEKNELRVGIHRAKKPENAAPASFISSLSMQHGILATATHAMCTGNVFTVYYRPWTSPGEFLVPYDQYTKSAEIDYSLGMRFRMQYEVEDLPHENKCVKFAGTIVGMKDMDHTRWPDSDWRKLEVQWDGPADMSFLPDKISPWSIEVSVRLKKKQISPITPNLKRSCPFDPLTANFPFRVKNTYESRSEVSQGQETRAVDDQNPSEQVLTNFCAPEFASYFKNNEVRKELAILDVNLFGSPSAQASNNPKCMLFGVNIFNRLPSPQGTQYSSTVSEVSKASPEQQCQNCSSIPKQSCTKVMKYGTALGRSMDLACFDGYEQLLCELDRIFEFEGTLIDGSSEWHVTYTDGEGDMMLLGDCPWSEFRSMVRKMFIYPTVDPDSLEPTS